MKFVLTTGPQAVGKMTVGQELSKITGLKLLHNHMTIEVLTKIFDYDKKEYLEGRGLYFKKPYEKNS